MAENIQAGIDALVMDERDHVATALRELSKGTDITCRLKEDLFRVKLLDDIEFGHKLAIRDIAKGTLIRKYGEVIGKATQDIATGQHGPRP